MQARYFSQSFILLAGYIVWLQRKDQSFHYLSQNFIKYFKKITKLNFYIWKASSHFYFKSGLASPLINNFFILNHIRKLTAEKEKLIITFDHQPILRKVCPQVSRLLLFLFWTSASPQLNYFNYYKYDLFNCAPKIFSIKVINKNILT